MGHLMFYAHMVQMAFLLFIIPPLINFGNTGMAMESYLVKSIR